MECLERFLEQTPLLEKDSTIKGISSALTTQIVPPQGGAIYFGTGLTTAKSPSVGLPFDVLGMVLIAEKLRRLFGLDHIVQLIADTHAKSNPFIDHSAVDTLASYVLRTMKRVSTVLNLEEVYQPVLSSTFDHSAQYLDVLSSIQTEDHEYVKREWSDIEFLRRHYGLKLKLSWTIGGKVKKVGFDERLYDLRFCDIMNSSMSFAYMSPGRTFDVNRQKVSPYISVENESRILLLPQENVASKFMIVEESGNADKLQSTFTHLALVIREFENIYGKLGTTLSLAEKVQRVISLIFQ